MQMQGRSAQPAPSCCQHKPVCPLAGSEREALPGKGSSTTSAFVFLSQVASPQKHASHQDDAAGQSSAALPNLRAGDGSGAGDTNGRSRQVPLLQLPLPLRHGHRTLPQNQPQLDLILRVPQEGEVPVLTAAEAALQHLPVPSPVPVPSVPSCSGGRYQGNALPMPSPGLPAFWGGTAKGREDEHGEDGCKPARGSHEGPRASASSHQHVHTRPWPQHAGQPTRCAPAAAADGLARGCAMPGLSGGALSPTYSISAF